MTDTDLERSRGFAGGSIPVAYTRLVARELDLQTRQLPALLQGTGLKVEQLLEDETRLSAEQQIRVLENALECSQDPALGLRLGRRLTPATHGPMGFLVNSSPNLLAALKGIQAYILTRMSFVRLELTEAETDLICQIHLDVATSGAIKRLVSEACGMAFFAFAEFIVGRSVPEIEARFAYPAPAYSPQYADFLPGCIRFSCVETSVRVPLELCEVANATANPESYALAQAQCEALKSELRSQVGSYRHRLEKMMLQHPAGTLSEDEAAAALFMTKRTLGRRLKAEGCRFRQVRDDILARQALGYLRDSQLSIEAIAEQLNYHDSANFRRAFKRWFQMTPDQYRRELVAE